MPFSLMPEEAMVGESQYSTRFLFWGESGRFRITNRRLALTQSQFGSEVSQYMPLENIDSMQEGKSSSPRWLIAAVIFFIIGVPLLLLGGLGALIWIPAVVCLVIWFLKRRETLVVKSGNGEIRLDSQGLIGFSDMGQLLAQVDEARTARLRELYK